MLGITPPLRLSVGLTIFRNSAVSGRTVGADANRKLGFLEYAQVQVVLGDLPQLRLKSSVLDVLDVVGSEPNQCSNFVLSLALPPPSS